MLAAEEDAGQVDVEHPAPDREVGGQHRDVPGEEDAGVVDENVHAAVARLDRRVELRDALLVRDVDGEGLRLAARVDELRRHRPRCFLGHVGAGDSSALGGQDVSRTHRRSRRRRR